MKDTKVFPNCFLAVLWHHIRAFRYSGSSICTGRAVASIFRDLASLQAEVKMEHETAL
jgi:hypothetical protein